MVPAIGSSENVVLNSGEAPKYGGATKLPVSNFNVNNDGDRDKASFLDNPRPVNSYAASIFFQQGLLRDPIRGPIATSSQRESPSRVGYGVNTPGRPIYSGGLTDDNVAEAAAQNNQNNNLQIISRRPGHSFIMDDGDLIGRDQHIRLRSSLGHQILLSDSGQCLTIIHANGQSWVELGKEGTVDVFSTNSINLRTQGDLNLHADNNINIQALKTLNINAESIAVNTEKDVGMRVGTDYKLFTQGNYTAKVNGAMSQNSDGEASYSSGATTYVNGTKINLNSGEASLVPEEVAIIPIVAHTDTLNDTVKGWAAAPGKLLSIVTRAPAHMPWSAANQGIDIKVSGAAADALPSNPSAQVAATNTAVANVSTPTTSSALISTVPSVSTVSSAIDKNMTTALVSQTAVLAATGVTSQAVKDGFGVIPVNTNGVLSNVASIGQLAQTPAQLEAAGVLKPGSSNLVNALVNRGQNIPDALTNNMFTGKTGAENLTTFVNNTQAQVDSAITTFQQAQTGLQNSGLITGKESGTQLGSLVMSAATQGVQATVNFAASAAGNISNPISGAVGEATNTLLGPVNKMLAAGSSATNLASTVTGGLSSITNAIGNKGINSLPGLGGITAAAKGVAGAAFAAVTAGFPSLASGVPQNLKQITKNAQSALGNMSQGPAGIASLASGLNSIPGAAQAVSSIVNKGTGALNAIPGQATISSIINNKPADLINKLKNGTASLASLAATGLPSGSIAQLNSAITSLTSGGAIPIQLPKVGLQTFNRDVIGGQISSALNNPKIPLPNYSGNPSTYGETAATAKVSSVVEQAKALETLNDQITAQITAVRNAKEEYIKAVDENPEGSTAIAAAKTAYTTAWTTLSDKFRAREELLKTLT
jgi:hypothetical protein